MRLISSQERPPRLPRRGRQRPKVLIVDDDPMMRIYASEYLEEAGFTVLAVDSGRRAVAAVRENRPDLVVLDVRMPGMDGFDTCRQIRACPENRHTPILMLTALDDIESIGRAYEVRATDFATKPANWTLLAHRLEYMLRASRSALELRRSRARLANAQRIAKLGYWECDVDSGRLAVSGELRRMLDLSPTEQVETLGALLSRVDPEDRETVQGVVDGVLQDGQSRDVQFLLTQPGGDSRSVRQRVELSSDDTDGARRLTGVLLDVTDQERAEARARFLAHHDALTGLPNRRSLTERLQRELRQPGRGGSQLALMVVHLDRFTRVNETLGREIGDQALCEISERLAGLRNPGALDGSGSKTLVGRLGTEEFALLITEVGDPSEVGAVAERVKALIAEPVELGSTPVVLTASIGICLSPADGTEPSPLIANAEVAVRSTRDKGGNGYRFYSREMNENAVSRLELEAEIGRAVERGELVLDYQPQYDTERRRIVGVEALIRWHHPHRGVVPPSDFIPLAEETGAITVIGEWALYAACIQAKQWQHAGLGSFPVSVNVSGRQFEDPAFPRVVERALRSVEIEPRWLTLELTESVLLEDVERTARTLRELKRIGVGLSLDDFGTGYSSLSYLTRLPLDSLKIDRSFLRGVPRVRESSAVIQAILALARGMDMKVVAEGVEEDVQVEFLREHGCDTLQGFLLSKPLRAVEMARLLTRSLPVAPEESAA